MAVDKRLLHQINNEDPKARRQAIVALADSSDAAALSALAEAARTDPDEKLRNLADRAQKHLQERLNRAEAAADSAPRIPASKPAASAKDAARGKTAMEEALSYYLIHDSAKATQSLTRAVAANPALKHDSYFLGLAGTILEVPPEEAMQVLFDSGRVKDYISSAKKSQKQTRRDTHYGKTSELPWSAVWFDLGVFAAVTAVITFLLPLVFVQMIGRALETQAALSAEALAEESLVISGEVADFYSAVNTVGVPVFLVIALATAASSAVSMLIQGGAIHVIATRLLNGTGTLRYMLCQVLPYYSMTSLVLFVWLCIALGILAVGAGIIGLICLAPMSLAGLVILFKVAGKIGAAYDFGAGKGLLALLGSSLLMALISAPLAIVAENALSSWLARAILSGPM